MNKSPVLPGGRGALYKLEILTKLQTMNTYKNEVCKHLHDCSGDLGKHHAPKEVLQTRRGYEPEGVLFLERLHGVGCAVDANLACQSNP